MGTPFLGEIRMFGGNFAPLGWAFCEGQLIPIAENDALFILLGTTYGGDGQETFALPDLRGRIPIHQGTGAGLSSRTIGEAGGQEAVTLAVNNLPLHSHSLVTSSSAASADYAPGSGLLGSTGSTNVYAPSGTSGAMRAGVIASTGGNQPHSNMGPSLCVSFIISLYGVFPQQS